MFHPLRSGVSAERRHHLPSTPHPSEIERLVTKPVHYQWSTPDGTVHHASSVVVARTRSSLRAALKQFWLTNPHVSPEL